MRKYLYIYNSSNITLKTCKINDLIDKINKLEELDNSNNRLTIDKLHNWFQGKTKKPNHIVLRCIRSRI